MYLLEALFCKQHDADCIIDNFSKAVKINLEQDIALIPITRAFYKELHNSENSKYSEQYTIVDDFDLLTSIMEQRILYAIGDREVIYIEAIYQVEGGQKAITWKENIRASISDWGQDVINHALKKLGVKTDATLDEFDTLQLGRYRSTEDWIS